MRLSAGSLKLSELRWRSACPRWNWSSLLSAAVPPLSGTPIRTPVLTTASSTTIPEVLTTLTCAHTPPLNLCLKSFSPPQRMLELYIQHWWVWTYSKGSCVYWWSWHLSLCSCKFLYYSVSGCITGRHTADSFCSNWIWITLQKHLTNITLPVILIIPRLQW